MSAFLRNPILLWISRLLLGVVFLIAAYYKLTDLGAFATSIKYYDMVPLPLISWFATVLAGVELTVGLALVCGVWREAAALLVAVMLWMFVIAIGVAYARGLSIECGCFQAALAPERADEVRNLMLWRLVEDIGMLVLAANLWIQERSGLYREAAED